MGRKDKKDKEELFLKNGSMLFERLIVSTGGKYKNPIRFFSAKELMKATNNYDQSQTVHQDLDYQLYKGYLENQNVMVKKYNYDSTSLGQVQDRKEKCMMDVVTTCQMICHKNVVKLLGCCLETTVPTLVYDFASEGILSDHLFGDPSGRNGLVLSFEARLKIAAEIASAITYLHTAFSRPIILRDFKTSTILLDKNSVAKLHDFSLAILIPVGETHVQTYRIFGTFGCLAPEYAMHGRVTEKIDVYSFGVFLHELLSGRHRFYLETEIENKCYDEILDPVLRGVGMDELKQQQLFMVLKLAAECVEKEEERRPAMIDVARELRRIRKLV